MAGKKRKETQLTLGDAGIINKPKPFTAFQQAVLDGLATLAIAEDNRSMHLLTGSGVARLLRILEPRFAPTSYDVVSANIGHFMEMVQKQLGGLYSEITTNCPHVKVAASTDGWTSPGGHAFLSLWLDVIDPITFKRVRRCVGCMVFTERHTGQNMHNVLSAVIKRMNVEGWDKLEDCIGSLTTDSAKNVLAITSTDQIEPQKVTEITHGEVPLVGAVIAVYDDTTEDKDFFKAKVKSISLNDDGSVAEIAVWWYDGVGVLDGTGDGFDYKTRPAKVKNPYFGTPDPDDPDQLLGGGVIDKEQLAAKYETRTKAAIFGNPMFESVRSVPGVLSFCCVPHMCNTVLSAVISKKKAKAPARDLYVDDAHVLIKNTMKIAHNLHFMGSACKTLYDEKMKHIMTLPQEAANDVIEIDEEDIDWFSALVGTEQGSSATNRVPKECETRWMSMFNPALQVLSRSKVVREYVGAYNSNTEVGKKCRGNNNPLPELTDDDLVNIAGILTVVLPLKVLNIELQSDEISFGGAWTILRLRMYLNKEKVRKLNDRGEECGELIRVNDLPNIAQRVHKGIFNLLQDKVNSSFGLAQQKCCCVAALLTPGCSKIFQQVNKDIKKENIIDLLNFVDQIYNSDKHITHLREMEARRNDYSDDEVAKSNNIGTDPLQQQLMALLSEGETSDDDVDDPESGIIRKTKEEKIDDAINILPSLEDEWEAYYKEASRINFKQKKHLDIKHIQEWFKDNTSRLGIHRLSFLATSLAPCKITSANDERSFSVAGEITRGKRGSLGGSRTEELLVVGLNSDLCTGDTWHKTQLMWKNEFHPVSKSSGPVSQRSVNHINGTTNVSKATSSFAGLNYYSGESSQKKTRPGPPGRG
ncbi:hypothetical protein TrRE_jg2190 [Triparma retinervis]|uniref:HAT C-terminal dimerisation domain-containing protein n=1 Tax=Triparma retinervis TaxID=2557542 RepID=A0A9W7G0D8_9STRA|nr:hypothetical protein TrRE_jg2190 [Triparma retinervis]